MGASYVGSRVFTIGIRPRYKNLFVFFAIVSSIMVMFIHANMDIK
jgi:uncharacterized phage infection (PIP) family protein YhgE